MTQAVRDMDGKFAKEFGVALPPADTSTSTPATRTIR